MSAPRCPNDGTPLDWVDDQWICPKCGDEWPEDVEGTEMIKVATPEAQEAATRALHEKPCPGCGFEPEVRDYLRDRVTKIRRGYYCTCGAAVLDGLLIGNMP